ncbi:MAG: 30S ribosomal protein S12 methylthiotransferase RimO [Erysipelotrichaceae bacterium]|nr:30S ribosomal protein S12 methylthiotransferase RimO [Erysipelotrichaceae bacterium]
MKVGLISLGCAKNLVDSEMILSFLDRNEFEIVNDANSADIIFINTCGFIEASKQESINTILEFTSLNKIVVVTGCLVERYLEDLEKELPEVDLFLPIREYPNMALRLQEVIKNKSLNGHLDLSKRIISTRPFSAYLKISEGCSNCCTYCAIPLIRGSFHSFDKHEVINQALALKEKGVKELVVISQDTTKYGSDIKEYKTDIVDLLKSLLEIKEFEYIRLLYLYPDEISDELIELMGKEERLTPYFDIPIQHASSKVLKAMNRRGDKEFLLNLFNKIKEKVPNAILRTTLIVGFPGESEEDFNELYDFINEVKFDHLGAFTYSREEDTKSYDFDNQIEEKVKKARYRKIMMAQKKISRAKNKNRVGEIHIGLVIDYDYLKNVYYLRSHFNAPDDIDGSIIFKSEIPLEEGQKVKVKITGYDSYNLYGDLIEK